MSARGPESRGKYEVIDGVRIMPDGREICENTAQGRREYYQRTCDMMERQRGICPWCKHLLTIATFDHQSPRGAAGGFRDDRIVDDDGNWLSAAMHAVCNGLKGSRRFHWVKGQYVAVKR